MAQSQNDATVPKVQLTLQNQSPKSKRQQKDCAILCMLKPLRPLTKRLFAPLLLKHQLGKGYFDILNMQVGRSNLANIASW